jgi:hypothetical protein
MLQFSSVLTRQILTLRTNPAALSNHFFLIINWNQSLLQRFLIRPARIKFLYSYIRKRKIQLHSFVRPEGVTREIHIVEAGNVKDPCRDLREDSGLMEELFADHQPECSSTATLWLESTCPRTSLLQPHDGCEIDTIHALMRIRNEYMN